MLFERYLYSENLMRGSELADFTRRGSFFSLSHPNNHHLSGSPPSSLFLSFLACHLSIMRAVLAAALAVSI